MSTLDGRRADVAVVIAAGGAGVRMGPGGPKALRELAGEPLLRHAVRGVLATGRVGRVVVAAPPGREPEVQALLASLVPPQPGASTSEAPGVAVIEVVTGGVERSDSVRAALAAVPAQFPIVLVHDAARALTPPALTAAVATAVRGGAEAVVPVLPVIDTIAEIGTAGEVIGNPDRSRLRAVQTPQGFQRQTLESAYAAEAPLATDDAGLVLRLGLSVQTVAGSPFAMKITTAHDLLVAEALLRTHRPVL